MASGRVELVPQGLRVARGVLPLLAGAVHYFRLAPESWHSALEAVKALGLSFVDTYVPWGVHERADGTLDFGEHDPQLDVVRFIRAAEELGLFVIVRPGPHVNAELTHFGIPERVIWTKACQALSASGRPVTLPAPPLAFPVPSYASEAFHAEARVWLGAVAEKLAPLVFPNGPIVLCQVDNEGTMYFRDGVYDQDHHPDAVAGYREFLKQKYPTLSALRDALRDPGATHANAEPPRRFDGEELESLARHLDWAEYQEALLARALERFGAALRAGGLENLPTSHNLPLAESVSALDPQRVGHVVDLVGLDYYHRASADGCAEIARRTSELAERAAARGHPSFACELGAGYAPFFPPLSERDNAFTALSALAYGLRGYNLYMAVDRDRWIGAPVDRRGNLRESAEFWQRLSAALGAVRFFELERRAAVHLVVPRSLRRLRRVLHAFGPLSASALQVFGADASAACFEDELGGDASRVIAAEDFLRELEGALEAERVPYAFSAGDLLSHSLKKAKWTIVACSGALEPELARAAVRARERGRAVSFGPFAPAWDAAFRPLDERVALPRQRDAELPVLLPLARDELRAAVARAKRTLELPFIPSEPDPVRVTVHSDARGRARVLFVINPTDDGVSSRVEAGGARRAVDLLDGASFRPTSGRFEIEIAPRSVRMMELETGTRPSV